MTRRRPDSKAAVVAATKTVTAASAAAATATAAAAQPPAPVGVVSLLQSLTPFLSSPVAFLAPSAALTASLLSHAKLCYDRSYTASSSSALLPPNAVLSSLPSLLLDGFTVEQVWEQVQLLHRPLLQRLRGEIRRMEKIAASGASQEEKESMQRDEQVEDDEEDAESEDADQGSAAEQLDGDEAEMEARLDAMEAKEQQQNDDDDDEQSEDDDADEETMRRGRAETELSDGADDDGAEQRRPDRLSLKRGRSAASAASPAAAVRDVSADAFFSLEQMERFADHFERIDNNPEATARRREKIRADKLKRKRAARQDDGEDAEEQEDDDDADDAADEYGGDVDLDVDVGEVDLAHGEQYGDFFDPPTAEELRGQSITEMEEGGEAGDDGEKDEEGEGEEDAAAPSPEDEFGGYFARLAAQQRKMSAQPPAAAAGSSSSQSSEPQSSYARQQAALQPTLASIEHQLVNPKPWYHRGEVTALQRPADSLLQQEVEVDWAGKEREVITAEVNEQIEDVIRRRVSEQQYDDVVRKEKPRTRRTVRDDAELSSERSSKGLAQLYEEEYMEKKQREDAEAAGGAAPKTSSKAQQQRDPQVAEIRSLLSLLLSSLSSLSNYSLSAPVSSEEVRIVRGEDEQQLLMREEVGIDFESGEGGAKGRSRKEVGGGKTQGEMVGEGEREQQERRRRRRRVKAAGRKRKREEEELDKQRTSEAKPNRVGGRAVLTAKEVQEAKSARNVKEGVVSAAAATARYGKSSSFFRELQANVQASEKDAMRERAGKT